MPCSSKDGSARSLEQIGRIYQQTFIDTYTRAALVKLYDRKNALVAADALERPDVISVLCAETVWVLGLDRTAGHSLRARYRSFGLPEVCYWMLGPLCSLYPHFSFINLTKNAILEGGSPRKYLKHSQQTIRGIP